jgi:hypothetical protein
MGRVGRLRWLGRRCRGGDSGHLKARLRAEDKAKKGAKKDQPKQAAAADDELAPDARFPKVDSALYGLLLSGLTVTVVPSLFSD